MSNPFELPPLQPELYRWHPNPEDSSLLQRSANGVETWCASKDINQAGCYDFYQAAVLRLVDVSGLSLTKFKKALVRALLDARFENPTISCYAVWGKHEKAHLPYITYKSFDGTAEAEAWANDIIQVRNTHLDSQQLRAERFAKRQASGIVAASNPLDVIVSADVASEDTIFAPGTKVEAICFFNHATWDGKGRFFCAELLQRAVDILDSGKDAEPTTHKWGEEKERLDKPLLDSMQVGLDELDNDELVELQKEFIEKHSKIGASWGIKVNPNLGPPGEVRHTLTAGHSKKIQAAVKSRLGGKYNDGHLGHAATILVMLDYNPIPEDKKDSACLYSPLPIDGRRYLDEARDTERYGNIQTSAVVEIKRLADWAPKGDDPNATKVALEKLCKHLKKGYDYWLNQPDYHLPMGVAYHNWMSDGVA
jgi:hypothetical protein